MFVVVTIFAVAMFVVFLLMRLPFATTIFAAVMYPAAAILLALCLLLLSDVATYVAGWYD